VTSVAFSITIVALTLAAGQFGSRVLRNFIRDRGNQITLGTFIATFVYALLVLRPIQGVDNAEFVPPMAMSMGILLVFVSVGILISFIHHVASSIQVDSVVRSIAVEHDLVIRLRARAGNFVVHGGIIAHVFTAMNCVDRISSLLCQRSLAVLIHMLEALESIGAQVQ